MTLFAFDLTPLAMGERGGVSRFARELAHRWLRGSCESRDRWLLLAPRPVVEGLPAGGDRAFSSASTAPPFLWRRTTVPREIAARGAAALFSPIAAVPSGRLSCPVVATVHDVPAAKLDGGCSIRKRFSLALTTRRAARIVVPSEATRRDLSRLHPESASRIRVVALGISSPFLGAERSLGERLEVRRRLAIPDGPYLLGVGLRRHRKNPLFLLDLIARLSSPPVGAVITGDGPVREAAVRRHAARLGVGARVQLVGDVSDEDLVALLDGAAAVVIPSEIEGFGLPAVEGMARGVPVLASDRGALPEVVAEGGLVLPHGDLDRWAVAASRVLEDDGLRRRLAAAGRARSREFDWDRTASAIHEILSEAVAAGAAGA